MKTGEILGQLSSLAKASTEATLDRKLIACLLKERVGTKKIEFEDLKLAREAQKKGLGPGGAKKNQNNNVYIQENRVESQVMDLLNLKHKYAKALE